METEAIVEILGGRKVLGKTIKNMDDLTHLIRKGLPAGSISALAEKLHIGNSVLSRADSGACEYSFRGDVNTDSDVM